MQKAAVSLQNSYTIALLDPLGFLQDQARVDGASGKAVVLTFEMHNVLVGYDLAAGGMNQFRGLSRPCNGDEQNAPDQAHLHACASN
jgi:hypothetical protein